MFFGILQSTFNSKFQLHFFIREALMKWEKILTLTVLVVVSSSLTAWADNDPGFFLSSDTFQHDYSGGFDSATWQTPQGTGNFSFDTPIAGNTTHDSLGSNLEHNLLPGAAGVPDLWDSTDPVFFELRARIPEGTQNAGQGSFVLDFRDNRGGNDLGMGFAIHDDGKDGVYIDCQNDCQNGSNFFSVDTSDFHNYGVLYEPTGGSGDGLMTLYVDRVSTGLTMDSSEDNEGGNSRGANALVLGDNCGGCYRGVAELDAFRIGPAIPEPGTLCLLVVGGLSFLLQRRRQA